MELLGIIIALGILSFSAWRIYLISKKGTIDENSWSEIRLIGYESINNLVKLYTVQDDKDAFVDFIITVIVDKVNDNQNLTIADKAFWNKDNINAIFRPVIVQLVDKIIEKTDKK